MMPCRAIRYHTPPQGGFGLRVSTTFSLNWPLAGTARLPLAMEIELVELSGPVRLRLRLRCVSFRLTKREAQVTHHV